MYMERFTARAMPEWFSGMNELGSDKWSIDPLTPRLQRTTYSNLRLAAPTEALA